MSLSAIAVATAAAAAADDWAGFGNLQKRDVCIEVMCGCLRSAWDPTDENGRSVKIASIIGEHTRECVGGPVERSITADRLVEELGAS